MPKGVTIKLCADVDFQKLKLYTEDVIGFTFDRSNILESWISLPTHTSLTAVKENGEVLLPFKKLSYLMKPSIVFLPC